MGNVALGCQYLNQNMQLVFQPSLSFIDSIFGTISEKAMYSTLLITFTLIGVISGQVIRSRDGRGGEQTEPVNNALNEMPPIETQTSEKAHVSIVDTA